MREQLARLVFPVFRRGLLLREGLRHAQLNMAHEQGELMKLIRAADGALSRGPAAGEGREGFLGVGYPLACWLDEVFILDPESPWKGDWIESALEERLYHLRERASRFWAQEQLPQVRSDPDVLEAFYLAVMLGFRGDPLSDSPLEGSGALPGPQRLLDYLQDWRQTAQTLLGVGRVADWPDKPPELPVPPPDVPPRHARERLLWVLLGFGVLGGAAILGAVFVAFVLP
jgi:type VI secretion system protein ImpK